MYIYTILLRMTDTVTSQDNDLSSKDTLHFFFQTSYIGLCNTEPNVFKSKGTILKSDKLRVLNCRFVNFNKYQYIEKYSLLTLWIETSTYTYFVFY
jgi:hypothetical protein